MGWTKSYDKMDHTVKYCDSDFRLLFVPQTSWIINLCFFDNVLFLKIKPFSSLFSFMTNISKSTTGVIVSIPEFFTNLKSLSLRRIYKYFCDSAFKRGSSFAMRARMSSAERNYFHEFFVHSKWFNMAGLAVVWLAVYSVINQFQFWSQWKHTT